MRPSSSRLALRLVPVLGLCAALATPIAAHAEEGEDEAYPIVFAQRPLTLNKEQFVAQAIFDFHQPGPDLDMEISLLASVDYGVMKNLTIGALAVPLGLSPETDFGNPTAYVLYRFLRGATPVELGVELDATFPVQDGTHFGIAPGLRAKYDINEACDLRVGAFVDIVFSDPVGKALRIPVDLAISFTRNIYFQLETGFNLPDFDPDFLFVPLGVKLGYTLPKNNDSPLADIFLGFEFTSFLGPKLDISNGTTSTGVNTDAWSILLGGRVFL